MSVEIRVKVECPKVPNFLRFGKDVAVDIKEFTDEQLKEIGEEWTKQIIAVATERRQKGLND